MNKLHSLFSHYNQQSMKADMLENGKFTAKSDDDDSCCVMKCCDCLQGFANCMSNI